MRGFGPEEFSLALLRRMADYQPARVERLVRDLGHRPPDVAAAYHRWQRMLHSRSLPGGLQRYRLVLGPPTEQHDGAVGDTPYTRSWWRLPLWPDLRWEVVTGPGEVVWQTWLVRPPGRPAEPIASLDDLVPWEHVVADVGTAFPGARLVDEDYPSRCVLLVEDPSGGAVVASFAWGLLQLVAPQAE